MPLPLSGLLVVSLEQAVAAPMCTCRLADAGARVIKVERPEGDFARSYDKLAAPTSPRGSAEGESAYFVWLNRGKESLVLDLARADDKALLAAILAKADVFVQNLKPGAVAKLGFALDALRRAHPRLVSCSISGYGEDGPYAARKAYDMLVQAESGLASVTGGPEAPALAQQSGTTAPAAPAPPADTNAPPAAGNDATSPPAATTPAPPADSNAPPPPRSSPRSSGWLGLLPLP